MNDPLAIGAVLLSAALHASWNAVVKSDPDRSLSLGVMMGAGAVMALPVLAVVGLPPAAAWPYLAGTTLVHLVYCALLLRAYASGDLGTVYPIARGLGPLLVAVGGSLAGERLLARDWLGVGLVSAGIFGLASRGAVRPAAVGWALGTGVAIGTYTTIDGLGARAAGDPLLYVAWLHLLFGPWIALAVGLRRGRAALPWLRRHGARSALGGVVATVGYGLAVWAFSRAGLAHMAALREVSVLFAAVIGAVWLGEGWGWRRLAAAATIVAGLLLLNG